METHYILQPTARGYQRAVCGIRCEHKDHAPTPSCAECRRILEDDEASFSATFGDPTVPLAPSTEAPIVAVADGDPVRDFNDMYARHYGGRR